jgi:hypothetical protein
MLGFGIGFIVVGLWLAFEVWRAPMIDEYTGRILRPTKKLSDLFKKNNKNK